LSKKKDDRPSPVRLSNKSLFILEKLKVVNNGTLNKCRAIEDSLCKDYPLFSEMYDKENK